MTGRERLRRKTSTISRLTLALLTAATVAQASYEPRKSPLPIPPSNPQESLFTPKIINRLTVDLKQLQKADVVLIFNTGGWGNTGLEEAPGWKEIIQRMTNILQTNGYHPQVLENLRQESALDIIWLNQPSSAAEETALRIKQLREVRPDLQFILIGWSSGATFAEKVINCLDNPEGVFAIEVGEPFSSRRPPIVPEQTLTVANEGDVLSQGKLPSLIKETWPPSIFWAKHGGDFGLGPIRVAITLPFHLYSWEKIGGEIQSFLEQNFPAKESSLPPQR